MEMQQLDRSIERKAKELAWAIWNNKRTFLSVGTLIFSATLIAFLFLQPVYEGSTLLIVGQTNLQTAEGQSKGPEFNASLARIAQSDEVVRQAVEKVGLDRIVLDHEAGSSSVFMRLRSIIFGASPQSNPQATPSETWLPKLSSRISVRAEPNSDIIRIAVRHFDAGIAAELANAIAQSFVDRQISLFSRPGAVEFFLRQKQRFDDEFTKASDRFEKFATETQTYSAEDQRQLLLKRRNDLSLALALTRNSIAEKTGQRQALASQLRNLAPVARSPYVSSLVETLSGERGPPSPPARGLDERSGDPPLLLIKVYQDSMVELFKINADIAGAESLQKQQSIEVAQITADLNRLSNNEKEFANLKRAVSQASSNSDLYSKRMVEEQIAAESNAARFSSLKVLQSATVPLRPVFPNYWLVVALGCVLALIGGGASALWREYFANTKKVEPQIPIGLNKQSGRLDRRASSF